MLSDEINPPHWQWEGGGCQGRYSPRKQRDAQDPLLPGLTELPAELELPLSHGCPNPLSASREHPWVLP